MSRQKRNQKPAKAAKASKQLNPRMPKPEIRKPTDRTFGTNPATSESHVSVDPGDIGGGFLDNMPQTMYA